MKKPIDITKENTFRTINISGADIYYANIIKKKDVTVINPLDCFHKLFSNLMPMNLDIIYLNQKKEFEYDELLGELYTYVFINVSFKYPLYLDKQKNKVPLKAEAAFPPYTKKTIRAELYSHGFNLNGVHYVRYKRSPGSAKGGSCLFVQEKLYNMLDKWSNTGLEKEKESANITSYEAYKALSLSSLVTTLELSPYNILFVKDAKVKLKNQKVIRVFKSEHLEAEETTVDIENNIFDGEGLLDASVFKQIHKEDKGMMLLRNRFFKCCAFNTNLQKWFKDNNITDVSQLYGETFAKDIKDIKLVVSASCLKYLKMCDGEFKDVIKRWCDNISNKNHTSIFGVVKYDKPTRFFQGRMVETTYQFLNTLPLKESGDRGAREFLRRNIEYIQHIRRTDIEPEFVRFYLEGPSNNIEQQYIWDYVDESEDILSEEEKILETSAYEYKKQLCLSLLNIDKNFVNVDLFKEFIFETIINALKMKVLKGRVLVKGTYATIFGNPLEFLQYILKDENGNSLFDVDNPKSSLGKDEIYTSFFADKEEITGTRAPHITMGNVLLATNTKLDKVDQYFNLSKEIVVVDAINNNIQHRLNGCDYDSDSILLTNDKYLVNAAKMKYNDFLVPYLDVKPNEDEEVSRDLAKIDDKIANNYVGKIVNLSQLLNSYYWDSYNTSKKRHACNDVYKNICILEALSNIEIDSAKRPFPVTTSKELNRFRAIKKEYGLSDKNKEPIFFQIIRQKKVKFGEIQNQEIVGRRYFKTAMDYIWKMADLSLDYKYTKTIKSADYFLSDYKPGKQPGPKYTQVDEIVEKLDKLLEIRTNRKKEKKKNRSEILDEYHLFNQDDYEYRTKEFQNAVGNIFKKVIKNKIREIDDAKYVIFSIIKEGKSVISRLFLFLYIIDVFSRSHDLKYSLADIIPDANAAVRLGSLKEISNSKKYEFSLFDSFYYERDYEYLLIHSISPKK